MKITSNLILGENLNKIMQIFSYPGSEMSINSQVF